MNPYHDIERKIVDAKSLSEITETLELLLSGGFAVWTVGSLYEIKQLVARINGFHIKVFSQEHAPPHFHVTTSDIDAVISVEDCSFIRGNIDGRSRTLVEWWHQRCRDTIITAWNESRRSDCPVGPVNG